MKKLHGIVGLLLSGALMLGAMAMPAQAANPANQEGFVVK